MQCELNYSTVVNSIEQDIKNKLGQSNLFTTEGEYYTIIDPQLENAVKLIDKINTEYKEEILMPDSSSISYAVATPSKELVESYLTPKNINAITPTQNKNIDDLKSIQPAYAKGTNEQVQKFIESKIPDSKIKQVVFHSTNSENFNEFDLLKNPKVEKIDTKGFHFHNLPNNIYGKNVVPSLININKELLDTSKEPFKGKLGIGTDNFIEYFNKEELSDWFNIVKKISVDLSKYNGYSLFNNSEFVVEDKSQITILNKKETIKEWEEFLSKQNNTNELTQEQEKNIQDLKNSDERWNKYSDEDIIRFIDSVFPYSNIKDIVYHGTKDKKSILKDGFKNNSELFEPDDNRAYESGELGYGYYFTKSLKASLNYGDTVIATLNNPDITNETTFNLITNEKAIQDFVKNKEQIYILNSDQAISDMDKFVGSDIMYHESNELKSNIQLFDQLKDSKLDSSNLQNDDLALMLFNQAMGLNLTSVNQLNWDNIKDNIFFEKEDGSLGVKNLAFTSGGFLKTSKSALNDFLNQKGVFPEHKVFIGETVIYPNVFEILEQNEIIKKAVFENLFNLSGAFEQVKNELNSHSPETFVIETPKGKFTFPKRFASGFFNIASKVELLLKENQSNYIQEYLANKNKEQDNKQENSKVKPVITQTLAANDKIIQNAISLIQNPILENVILNSIFQNRISLIQNPILENAIKNNISVKIHIFSNNEFSEDGIAGWYLPKSNIIYIHSSMLDAKHLAEGLPLIAHELLHSVTEQSLQFDKSFQSDIQNLLNQVKNSSQIKDFYGFKDTSEFLSEAFSSEEFRQLLKDTIFTSENNISAWQKFVNLILKILGKQAKYTNSTISENAQSKLNRLISQHSYKIGYVKSNINDKSSSNLNSDQAISDMNKFVGDENTNKKDELLVEQREQVQELEQSNLIENKGETTDGVEVYDIPSENAKMQLASLLSARKIDYLNIVGNELRVEKIPPSPIEKAVTSPGIVSTKAGKISKKMILDFLYKIGFTNIETVDRLIYKGQKIKGTAYVDLINAVMQIKDGMEDYTLPEEAMHILVALIKQSKPELYNALIKDVVNYKIYGETYNDKTYKDPRYKNDKGNLDLEKIKSEAVAKLLAEFLIGNLDEVQTRTERVSGFWQDVKNWIRNLFNKYKNPFEEVLKAIKLDATVFGETSDLKNREGEDFWLSGASLDDIDKKYPDSRAVWDTIKNRPDEENFSKQGSNYYKGTNQVTFTDDDFKEMSTQALTEAATYLKVKDISTNRDILVAQVRRSMSDRVTNLADAYLKKLFKGRNFDEKLKAFYEQSRQDGSYLHQIAELTIQSWIDPKTGLKRKIPEKVNYPIPDNPLTKEIVRDFTSYISNLMTQYKEGTRFLVEQVIYDKESDRFGTIDFMAIKEDGTVDLLDWKSMLLEDVEGAKDWKKDSIFIQMNEYARILSEQYGVTKLGKIRAIPIRKIYAPDKNGVKQLVKVQVGSANAASIGEDERYLRPIISPEESTGDEYKDFLIKKLDSLYKDYVKKGEIKNNRAILNTIKDAMYELRVAETKKYLGLYFTNITKEIQDLLKSEETLKTQEDREEALGLITYYEDIIKNVIDPAIGRLDSDDKSLKDLSAIGGKIIIRKEVLHKMRERIMDKAAKSEGVFNLLSPEKIINFFAKTFRNIGSQNIATARYGYEIIKKIYHKVDLKTDQEFKKLKELKFNIDKWVKSNGTTDKEMVAKLINFNTGGIHSKIDKTFFTERDRVFAEGSNKQIIAFVKENYDFAKYIQDYNTRLEELKDSHKYVVYPGGTQEDARVKRNAITNFKTAYSITEYPKTAFGKHNPLVFGTRNMIQTKWESPEYKEIAKQGNEPLLDMYNYMVDKNQELVEAGVLKEHKAYTFFPNARKGMADLLSINDQSLLKSTMNIIGQYYVGIKESLTVTDYEYNFEGARDPHSGLLLNKRYVPYVSKLDNDFELKRDLALELRIITSSLDTDNLDTKIEDYKNQSASNKKLFEEKLLASRQMSFDIFSVYALMAKEVAKETYLQESDETLRALLIIEGRKENIIENKYNVVSTTKGRPETGLSAKETNNYKALKGFVEEHVEGKKLDIDSDPIVKFAVSHKLREKWNNSPLGKLYKFDTDPESLKPTNISVVKFILMANRSNQRRILGLNLASAISNFFGGSYAANKLYQKYASKEDLHRAHAQLTSGAFYQSEDMKKRAALLDYALPYLNNREGYKASQLSINDAAKFFSQDWLMSPMRRTSEIVQANIFLAVIDNTGIINGKLVNLRVEAANDPQYKNRFNLSERERKTLEKEFEARVKKYKEDYSLTKVAQYKTIKEGGKDKVILELPGISRDSKDVEDLREIVQTMSKDALGEADEFDKADYTRSITWRMFMTFKNWIPRQADVRFGEFRLDQAHHSYEYGRFRMFARSLGANIGHTILKLIPAPYLTGKLTDAAFSKEALIQKAKEVYEEKMKEEKLFGRYNPETFISEDEFIAKFIEGSDAVYAELRTLMFMGILLMFGVATPDDDDDPNERAFKTLLRRQLNKLQDEVGFFYSPKSAIDIGGGGVPVFGMIRDYWFVMTNVFGEFFGLGLESLGFEETGEKMQEKAYPIKRVFKIYPGLKEILTYLPAINNDVAKDWGVKITEQRGQ